MSRRPRLLVIDPSVAYPERECVETVLAGWTGEHRVLLPALEPRDALTPAFGYDVAGVVLLGSRASVLDDLPWLRNLGAWLDPILDGSCPRPLLGICFGHQLLAYRAGAEVGFLRPDHASELGIRETVLDGSRLVPGRRVLRVVASHQEEVKTVPRGFRVTARRAGVDVDGLEHETLPLFGFQFHPEARAGFLDVRNVASSAMDRAMTEETDRLLGSFLQLVVEHGRITNQRSR